ncbi:MAG: RNA polymerase sigma factor [Hyphomicrobiaceae bacterium]
MSELLALIATDRSEEAFQKLFREFGPKVRNYMLRQGVDADLADDITQETLVTVWRKAGLYSPDKGSASTWMFTIARNLRIDRIRRQKPWQELTDDHMASLPSDDVQPDDATDQRQRQVRVQAVLRDLPPEQVEVVTLAFVDGLPHSEIATQLGLPLGTVKSRIRLAYSKLRTALEDLR